MRTWAIRIGVGAVFFAAAVLAMPAARMVSLWSDDAALDSVVVAVALDWRDFGLAKAQERLQYELDHQQIGPHVADHDCALTEEPGEIRQVRCAWSVAVPVPLLPEPWPLAFASVARIDRTGVLVR